MYVQQDLHSNYFTITKEKNKKNDIRRQRRQSLLNLVFEIAVLKQKNKTISSLAIWPLGGRNFLRSRLMFPAAEDDERRLRLFLFRLQHVERTERSIS